MLYMYDATTWGRINLKLLLFLIMFFFIPMATASDFNPGDLSGFSIKTIGDMDVYYKQRRIGDAVVEKDFVIYKVNSGTGKLIMEKVNWRDAVPSILPPLLPGEGRLVFIAPDSHVYKLNKPTDNPCWIEQTDIGIIIFDAVTGEIIGKGEPPPGKVPMNVLMLLLLNEKKPIVADKSIAYSGDPVYWSGFYENAETWFNKFGKTISWSGQGATRDEVGENAFGNKSVELYYHMAHGDQNYFEVVGAYVYAGKVKEWLQSREPFGFAFLGSCKVMVNSDYGTLAYNFTKGYQPNTCVVGYSGMGNEPCVSDCWTYAYEWQNRLFELMYSGLDVEHAKDGAYSDYPWCKDCIKVKGNYKLSR